MSAPPPTQHFTVPLPMGRLSARPLVSVLMASYNYGQFVAEAVGSVLQQTYGDFELIVCDDGSTDHSAEIVQEIARTNARLTLLRQENAGQSAALNTAFARSKGDILCLLDADDTFDARKLDEVVAMFRSDPECGLVANSMDIVDERGATIRRLLCKGEGYIGPECHKLRVQSFLTPCSGLSFRRDIAECLFPIPKNVLDADSALMGPAAYLTKTRILTDVLSTWRIHGVNKAADGSSLPELDPDWIEKRLAPMKRVLAYTQEYVRKMGLPCQVSGFRPLLEYRLSLGILRNDWSGVRKAARDLRKAYRENNSDYPYYRYLFWRTLASMPPPLAAPLLRLAYSSHKARKMAGR